MMGTSSRYRWLAGVTALALAAIPAGAQVRQAPADATGAAPAPTQTPIKINPRDVINTIDSIVNPKPTLAPTPTPTLAPTGGPTATPTATATKTPAPKPTATSAPRPAPTASTAPRPAAVATAEPIATVAAEPLPTAEPVPSQTATTPEAPVPVDSSSNYLAWIAAFIAALAAGGLALKHWLRPKLTVSCEIETGASTLTTASTPAITAPDLAFTIRIEPGEASAPTGNPILAAGDPA